MLGKYGIIYKNYLKEYKKSMYNNLKSRGRLEEQIKLNNPPPKTNEFMVMVRYNQMIDDLVHELLLKEMEFKKYSSRRKCLLKYFY